MATKKIGKSLRGGARAGSGRKVIKFPSRNKKLRALAGEWKSFQGLLSNDSRRDFLTMYTALLKHHHALNKLSENDLLTMAQTMQVVIQVAEITKRALGATGKLDCPRCETKRAIKYEIDSQKNIWINCKTPGCIYWKER